MIFFNRQTLYIVFQPLNVYIYVEFYYLICLSLNAQTYLEYRI